MNSWKLGNWVESLLQDLRYVVRTLRKVPGFTAIVIVTLALGVGANTAIFSTAYAILLRPLAYRDSARIVVVSESSRLFGDGLALSPSAVQEVKTKIDVFEQVGSVRTQSYRFSDVDSAASFETGLVTADFFSILGVTPQLGRAILPMDVRPESPRVVMVSYAFWQEHFGGDPAIVGRQLNLVNVYEPSDVPTAYTVVGVTPASFVSPGWALKYALWIPSFPSLGQMRLDSLIGDNFTLARLKDDSTVQRANGELHILSTLLAERFPKDNEGLTLHAQQLQDSVVEKSRLALLILLGAVGFLLLIACVNVSNLTIARALARRQEVAIRSALGATRIRIVRQFLTESLLLALAGDALGLSLGVAGMAVLRANAPLNTPRLGEVRMYPIVFWYALGISTCAGILFGLAPAFQASGRKLQTSLKNPAVAARFSGHGHRPNFYRHTLILTEVALCVSLLIGSGLAMRSFAKLVTVPLGFRTDHLLTMWVNLPPGTCKEGPACNVAFDEMLSRVRALPGVQGAAVANSSLLQGFSMLGVLDLEGWPRPTNNLSLPKMKMMSVGKDYFSTMGIPLLAGREFTDHDDANSQLVCVVNESFSKVFFSGSALGKRIPWGRDKNRTHVERWRYVVGVVKDARDIKPSEKPVSELYEPFDQENSLANGNIFVRTAIDPNVLAPAIREQILSVSKNANFGFSTTMDQLASTAVAEPRFQTFLLGAFAGLGLVLAVVGICGVVSYSVRQRTHEIGVRMALGAGPRDVLRLVLSNGLATTVFGIALGVGAALALTRYLQSLLFEVTPTDPATFAGVAILFLAVAFAACYIPARRAMRVDPMEALRYE
jgi:putative ABC transport system permease protein